VARLAQAFGMNTLFAAHKDAFEFDPEYASFDNVLETSDVISLHCPLMASTHNLIARPEFEKMKRRPLLINCARGGLVNEGDLVDALNQGIISGLGFDCLTTEPPKADNPLLSVVDRPNVIVTPHTAWASDEAMQTLWAQVVSNIENFQAEYPSNQVT
jgi:glycerate dehydrogenase